ncbi:DUF5011 domain-containing protein [Mycoplasmatota bacterium]|nr:DUF5011 domain-containing protein [Mycoplasmatota bacterium]
MKKLLWVFILIFILTLSACDDGDISTTIDSQTTLEPTDNEITSKDITTIINEDIYLKINAGVDTVDIHSDWMDAGAVFVLDDVEYDMTTSDRVDTSQLDVYPIQYEYTHNDIEYSMTRIVVVVDQSPPEIELNLGVDTVAVGSEWTDAGVKITDNSQEDITPIIEGKVDINTAGTYEIIYRAIDSSGNESSITRYVTVIE